MRTAIPLAAVFVILVFSSSVGAAKSAKNSEAQAASAPKAKGTAKKSAFSGFAAALGGSLRAPPMPVSSFFAPGRLWKRLGIDARPARGEWTEYEMLEQKVPVGRLKISVLPGTRRDNLILEVRTLTMGGPSYLKLLLRGGLDQPDNVERVMVAQPGIPPMELPLIDFDQKAKRAQQKGIEAAVDHMRIVVVGSEVMKVPAGEFRVRHTRMKGPKTKPSSEEAPVQETEFWTAPSLVKALGIVAWSRGGITYRLIEQGDGASSEIVPFPVIAPARISPELVEMPSTRKRGKAAAGQGKGSASAK